MKQKQLVGAAVFLFLFTLLISFAACLLIGARSGIWQERLNGTSGNLDAMVEVMQQMRKKDREQVLIECLLRFSQYQRLFRCLPLCLSMQKILEMKKWVLIPSYLKSNHISKLAEIFSNAIKCFLSFHPGFVI